MSSTMQNKASLPVIKRLPKYYRYLSNLQADGRDKISSSELARMMGTTASQVRQDFNCFGGFGGLQLYQPRYQRLQADCRV